MRELDYRRITEKPDTASPEDRSQIYTKLDNLIDYLTVYREDFQGKRIPNFEQAFLDRKRRESLQKQYHKRQQTTLNLPADKSSPHYTTETGDNSPSPMTGKSPKKRLSPGFPCKNEYFQ